MVDVELSGVGKSWGAVQVIRNLDLHVKDEEFLVLLGPSGCGKTTTMRMIAGLEDVTSGDIRVGGESVVGKLARERDIAMVFQNYGLYPHMSVADNIGYPLRLRKFRPPSGWSASSPPPAGFILRICSIASRARCPADNASASHWLARSCARRACSCSMNRFPTSMPSYGSRCARNSSTCITR